MTFSNSSSHSGVNSTTYKVSVNNKTFMVKIDDAGGIGIAPMGGTSASAAVAAPASVTKVCAPLPATVAALAVAEGRPVQEGDTLLVLSVMKMESHIVAPVDGVVQEVFVSVGEQVPVDHVLLTIA